MTMLFLACAIDAAVMMKLSLTALYSSSDSKRSYEVDRSENIETKAISEYPNLLHTSDVKHVTLVDDRVQVRGFVLLHATRLQLFVDVARHLQAFYKT